MESIDAYRLDDDENEIYFDTVYIADDVMVIEFDQSIPISYYLYYNGYSKHGLEAKTPVIRYIEICGLERFTEESSETLSLQFEILEDEYQD